MWVDFWIRSRVLWLNQASCRVRADEATGGHARVCKVLCLSAILLSAVVTAHSQDVLPAPLGECCPKLQGSRQSYVVWVRHLTQTVSSQAADMR